MHALLVMIPLTCLSRIDLVQDYNTSSSKPLWYIFMRNAIIFATSLVRLKELWPLNSRLNIHISSQCERIYQAGIQRWEWSYCKQIAIAPPAGDWYLPPGLQLKLDLFLTHTLSFCSQIFTSCVWTSTNWYALCSSTSWLNMCCGYCYLTWMFELHFEDSFTRRLEHLKAVFTFIYWRGEVDTILEKLLTRKLNVLVEKPHQTQYINQSLVF